MLDTYVSNKTDRTK